MYSNSTTVTLFHNLQANHRELAYQKALFRVETSVYSMKDETQRAAAPHARAGREERTRPAMWRRRCLHRPSGRARALIHWCGREGKVSRCWRREGKMGPRRRDGPYIASSRTPRGGASLDRRLLPLVSLFLASPVGRPLSWTPAAGCGLRAQPCVAAGDLRERRQLIRALFISQLVGCYNHRPVFSLFFFQGYIQ